MVQAIELKQRIEVIMNFFNAKRYDEVIDRVKPLLRKNPNEVFLHNLLGLSLNGDGKSEEGIKVLKKALNRFPNNIFVLNNIGLVNTSLNNYKEAEEYYKKALQIKEDFLDVCINFSNLKLNLNQGNEALKILKKIENKNLNNYVFNFTFGNAYQQVGDFENSIKYFNKCLELKPENTIADKSLSMMIKYNNNEKHYKSMMEKVETKLDENSKLNLYFAIGKAKEDMKIYHESFEYIKKGNDIKNKLIKYNFLDDLNLTNNSKELFSDDKIELPQKKQEKKYIFIVGMPRSGTTLVEQILSSHKKVYGAGELNYMTNLVYKFFLNENHIFKNKNINNFNKEDLKNAKNYYEKNTNLFNYQEKFMIDKAPLNFRWIGFILKLFPNSKIINCERDMMDICWSNYKNLFSSKKMNYSYTFKNISSFAKMYLDLISFWNKKFPNKIYNLNYEKLINKSDYEAKKLLEYCELEWDENCLNFYKNKKTVSTASVAQVRNPIYKTSIKNWENYSKELGSLKDMLQI